MQYKFATISGGRVDYINDENIPVNLADFRPAGNPGKSSFYRPNRRPDSNRIPYLIHAASVRTYVGLEHLNKSQKRSRFNYLEKAIKIYN